MEKAYIILAHKNPEQVERLIAALDDNHSHFFLHIDKNSNDCFLERMKTNEKLVLVERVKTEWGGFGIVQATLNAMNSVQNHPVAFNFVLLISGQHYPIKSNLHIHEFLRHTRHHAFLEHTSIPNPQRWKIRGGMYRIDKYFFGLKAHQRFTAKTLNFLSSKLKKLQRKFPEDMTPYAGSQWWVIDRYALNYILDFLKDNESYKNYHLHTFAPDELFFHNILLNAKDEKLRNGIANKDLLYMRWPDSNSGHPSILNRHDLPDMLLSDALFARKFDAGQDAAVLDVIDTYRTGKTAMAKQLQESLL